MALAGALASAVAGGAWAEDDPEATVFRASATLGADFYLIESPFDNDNVTGFFDQYRYIDDKSAEVPFFLNLTHANLGLVRPDSTYLLRLERWSRNTDNQNGILNVDWKGLRFDANLRQYRSHALRFFPMGTEDNWPGTPLGLGFGTTYNPGVPGLNTGFTTDVGVLFDQNYRIGVERLDFDAEIALRPEGLGYGPGWLREGSLRAGYGTRTGHRQDSFLLDLLESNITEPTSRFRGNRRAIDQTVTNAGLGAVIALSENLDASLSFDVDRFTENSGIVTLGDLASAPGGFVPTFGDPANLDREFFFVPDTNRYTGSLQLTQRGKASTLSAGLFASHIQQTGRLSNLQTRNDLAPNQATTVSAHLDGALDLGSGFSLRAFAKYLYRYNDLDVNAFAAVDPAGSQESPYIRERNEVRGSVELGMKPMRFTHLALGYAFDWVDRDLAYPAFGGVQPGVSLIHPRSSSHRIFLKGRARLFRGLRVSGELGHLWAPEVAYPNDLSRALSFRARGSYTVSLPLPVTLSLAGRVVDGENDEFDLPGPGPVTNGARRAKNFEQTDWGYDLTLTVLPSPDISVYSTFTQSGDEQTTDYVRTVLTRPAGGGAFYLDSIPHYTSDLKSLVVGSHFGDLHGADADLSAALTWADMMATGASGVGSNVGGLIGQANRIDSRILTVNADFEHPVRERLSVGLGYRFQQFIDEAQLGPLNLDETVHTVMIRVRLVTR
jgi:hypothetical protein